MKNSPKKKNLKTVEFGDFQTPPALATDIVALLCRSGIAPASIVEPTCGRGNMLLATCDGLQGFERALGVDISEEYIKECEARLGDRSYADKVALQSESFFAADWQRLLAEMTEPLLVIGNPPWVTSAGIGVLGGTNLPDKANFQNHTGLDAITGKSNFDISEWMLIRALHWLEGRQGVLAMLVKTSVARKLLFHAWTNGLSISGSALYNIDASRHFNAAVDACLIVCAFVPSIRSCDCSVYESLGENAPSTVIGWRDGEIVADITRHDQWAHLRGESRYRWRSGVKHDCSRVMEMRRVPGGYVNGLGEAVDIEDTYLFPLLKTSDVAKKVASDKRVMLVTQRYTGEDTTPLRDVAPKTWAYLQRHGDLLDARGSSIYRNRARFSVFGIGDYTFSPWKVATSGFYKRLSFMVIGPVGDKPVVLDDASYFIGCQSKEEAELIASLLNSHPAQEFLKAYIFWDAKRPITVDLLRRLDFMKLACELGQEEALQSFLEANPCH